MKFPFRHDDLIVRNGLYADMWSEQRKSTSDLPINEEPVEDNSNKSSTSKTFYHHPNV